MNHIRWLVGINECMLEATDCLELFETCTLGRFNLHCRTEETGSPGIICIICHQVLCHPSEHWTSSMGKHLLDEALIAEVNELTKSEVTELTSSMVDETALAILMRQGRCGITRVC